MLITLSTFIIGCDDIGDYGAVGYRSKSNDFTRKWTYNGIHSVQSGDAVITAAQGSRREKTIEFEPYPSYEKHSALVKVNADTSVEWHKIYPDMTIYKVHKTDDNSIYTFGAFDNKLVIIKHNNQGSIIWTKKYSVSLWQADSLNIIATTQDFLIASNHNVSSTAPFLLKLDINGNVLWSKYYLGLDYGKLTSIKTDEDGYIASTSAAQIIKFNKLGEVLWAKAFSVVDSNNDYIATVKTVIHPFKDGYLFSSERKNDLWLTALSKNGLLIWEYKYDSQYGINIKEMLTTSEGNIALIGNTISFREGNEPNTNRIWIAPINPIQGTLLWQKVFDLSGNDSVNSAYIRDKGFLLTGSYNDLAMNQSTNALLISIDSNGDFPDYKGKYKVRATNVEKVNIQTILDTIDNINATEFSITNENYTIEQKTISSVITTY